MSQRSSSSGSVCASAVSIATETQVITRAEEFDTSEMKHKVKHGQLNSGDPAISRLRPAAPFNVPWPRPRPLAGKTPAGSAAQPLASRTVIISALHKVEPL